MSVVISQTFCTTASSKSIAAVPFFRESGVHAIYLNDIQ
jgi:hypothetical protein